MAVLPVIVTVLVLFNLGTAQLEIDCNLPSISELQMLIGRALVFGDPTNIPDIVIADAPHYLCKASGKFRDKYSSLSLLANYTCSSSEFCRGGNPSQFDFECVSGSWRNQVVSKGTFSFIENPQATSAVETRTGCLKCIRPTQTSLPSDSLTHCLDFLTTVEPFVEPLTELQASAQAMFACYTSTGCHGGIQASSPDRGECCAGKGLSFIDSKLERCQNCFSMDEFISPGSEFFLAFFGNLNLQLLSKANIRIRVRNLEARNQTVNINDKTNKQTITIPPFNSEEITFDKNLRVDEISDQDNAVVVNSADQGLLSVSALGDEFTSSDMFHVLPCVYLPGRYEYYAVSVAQSRLIESDDDYEFVLPPEGKSVFIIVASVDNTEVMLTLTQTVTVKLGFEVVKGDPKMLILNRAETFLVSSENSLSGSHIVSNKPITLLSGHECGMIPADLGFCDQMVEQIPPVCTWGMEFYTVPLMSRKMDIFKVVSSRDDTTFSRACSLKTSTALFNDLELKFAGEEVSFNITSDHFCHFTSTHPVLLLQFSVGSRVDGQVNADPFMALVPPAKQYRNNYVVDHFRGSTSPDRERYYLNIIFLNTNVQGQRNEKGQRTDLLFNGEKNVSNEALWTEIKCMTSFQAVCAYGIQLELNNYEVVVSHPDPDARFWALSYTLGFRTGRGSSSGMTQIPIALDQITIEVPKGGYRVLENMVAANITLNRTGELLDNIIIPFYARVFAGAVNQAQLGKDFEEVTMDVLFPAQTRSIVVPVPLAKDDIFPEDNKVFEVYLGASLNAFVSPIAHTNVTIVNDDPPLPVMNISFSGRVPVIKEGYGILEVTLIKSEGAVGSVTVNLFTKSGTAIAGEDFEARDINVTFPVDVTEVTVDIKIINDDILESPENFSMIMEPVPGLFPLAVKDKTLIIQITDNDIVVIGFVPAKRTVSENGTGLTTRVEILRGKLDQRIQLRCVSMDSQASEEEDYFSVGETLHFSDSNTTADISVSLRDNSVPEDTEKFSLNLDLVMNVRNIILNNVYLAPPVMEITILDDDLVSVQIEGPKRVNESENVDIMIQLNQGDRNGRVHVGITTIPGTAKAFKNFQSVINREVVLDIKRKRIFLSIATYENDDYTGDGGISTFTVQVNIVQSDFDGVKIFPDSIQVEILDNDSPPKLDTECFMRETVQLVSSPENCCVAQSGMGYYTSQSKAINYTIPCIVIGFEQTTYMLRESREPYQLPVRVLSGGLSMNLNIGIDATLITATSRDYHLQQSWVQLRNGGGTIIITLIEDGIEEHVVETLLLVLTERSGITPSNVFFRGTMINIVDALRNEL